MARTFLSIIAVAAMLAIAAGPAAAESQDEKVAAPTAKTSRSQAGGVTVQEDNKKLKATDKGQCDQAVTMTAIALAESGGNPQSSCQ